MNAQQIEQRMKRMRIGDDLEIGEYRIAKHGRDNFILWGADNRFIVSDSRPFFVNRLINLKIVSA